MATLLSDDEVVALAAQSGSVWAVPLPTVDVNRPEELGAALLRGLRSLRMRDLLLDSGEDAVTRPDVAAFSAASTTPAVLIIHQLMPTTEGTRAGGCLLALRTPKGQVLLDLVSPTGVHEHTILAPVEALAVVGDYLKGVFDGEVGNAAVLRLADGLVVEVAKGAVSFSDGPAVAQWAVAEGRLAPLLAERLRSE